MNTKEKVLLALKNKVYVSIREAGSWHYSFFLAGSPNYNKYIAITNLKVLEKFKELSYFHTGYKVIKEVYDPTRHIILTKVISDKKYKFESGEIWYEN